MTDKRKQLNITKANFNTHFPKSDISVLEEYAGFGLPDDFKQFLLEYADATVAYPNGKYLYIGGDSASQIIGDFNILTHQFLSISHLAIATNGMSQTIIYAKDKAGNLRLYKVDDDEIDDNALILLADTFNDLVFNETGLQFLD